MDKSDQPPAAREERAVLSRCAFVFQDGAVCGDDAAHPKHFNHYNHDYVPPAAQEEPKGVPIYCSNEGEHICVPSLHPGRAYTPEQQILTPPAAAPSLRDGTREEERKAKAVLEAVGRWQDRLFADHGYMNIYGVAVNRERMETDLRAVWEAYAEYEEALLPEGDGTGKEKT